MCIFLHFLLFFFILCVFFAFFFVYFAYCFAYFAYFCILKALICLGVQTPKPVRVPDMQKQKLQFKRLGSIDMYD